MLQAACSLACVMVVFEENTRHAKGGLDLRCWLVFPLVLFVLETTLFCSLRVVYVRWFSSVLLYSSV